MSKKAINMQIEEEIYQMLKKYSEATGRSMTFVVEDGIKVAVSTDCRYGNVAVVPLVVGKDVWKVPEMLAKAIEEMMERQRAKKGDTKGVSDVEK
jgi:hypothetical protein